MFDVETIIFCKHAVETLEFFSKQLADCFFSWGYEVLFLDFAALKESTEEMYHQIRGRCAALVTFNCIGLSREPELWDEEMGVSIWENQGVRCLNIIVDHPMYYAKVLGQAPPMQVFCVDRDHVAYIRRFYPKISCEFLPLAGNLLPEIKNWWEPEKYKPLTFAQWEKRPFGLLFTANYVPLSQIEKHFDKMEPAYRSFYFGILETLQREPERNLLSVMEEHLRQENGEISDSELLEAMETMPVVDLWIRTYFRAKTVKSLVDAGIQVYLYGKDWEQLEVKYPQNLHSTGQMVDSAACFQAAGQAKLSLNTMPWFKAGTHDRIFTAMLQGAVAFTDDSIYLRENFKDEDTVIYYDIRHLDQIAEQVDKWQQKEEALFDIACRGRAMAFGQHTWKARAEILRNYLSV